MGTKNRQRRADKARDRARAEARRRSADRQHGPRRPPSGAGGGRGDDAGPAASAPRALPREQILQALLTAAAASFAGHTRRLGEALGVLAMQDPARVAREAEGEMLRRVGAAWANGWQPAEIVRQARRRDAAAARLVSVAIAADHLHRAPDTLHPHWARQVAELDATPVEATTGWLGAFGDRDGLDRHSRTVTAIEAIVALTILGRIEQLIPPPGAGVRAAATVAAAPDDPILVKVRALLAQAESTTYEAEAEAFTAKAQELMARHAIDAALVWSGTERGEHPVAIRIPLDDPYADAKATLLNAVASASRCRTVLLDAYGLSTVIGFAPDLAATELLFTSLLVQSAAALHAEGAAAPPGARVRSRGFRSSFLLAYASRVGHRLREVNVRVEAHAVSTVGDSLLPVLADRATAVDDTVNEMFAELRQIQRRAPSDRLGWARGHDAADRAELNVERLGSAPARGELG